MKVQVVLFFLGFIYLLWPLPKTVYEFPQLPNSVKSDLSGDTWQNYNLVAYYSDFNRDEITKFYRNFFENRVSLFGLRLPAVRANHAPEYAYQFVRDQQESTFLEEYIYPLKGSIFVNGYEPAVENKIKRIPPDFVKDHILYNGGVYNSKTTLKYYPNNPLLRVLIYTLIWVTVLALIGTTKKALREI